MTRIAYLMTSAREMTLADGTAHPTGYFAEEALKPYQRFAAAGFDVTVITPDGQPPYADPTACRGSSTIPKRTRTTWPRWSAPSPTTWTTSGSPCTRTPSWAWPGRGGWQCCLESRGHSPAQAHRIVSAAAKRAWRQDRQFADVLPRTARPG